MIKSKSLRIIVSVVLMLTIVLSFSNVFAVGITGAASPNIITGAEVEDLSGVTKLGNQVVTIISTVGAIVAVVVLIVLGIKYMMGSASEKAEYKKTLMPYVIGAALIFAASTLTGILYNFLTQI